MVKLIMKSWRSGLEKVTLTMLQIELLKISLKEAKNNVDSLLDNNEVILEIENKKIALEFYEKAGKIGVNFFLEPDLPAESIR
jgi:hypothetical protein